MKRLKEKICIFLLLLGVSFSICYWAIAKYDIYSDFKACNDAKSYIKMSRFEYNDVPGPYRYRILMPSLVFAVDKVNNYFHVEKFLNQYYEDVERKMIQLNFGIINIISLTFAAYILFYYCLHLGFSKWESLVGAFLFLTSFFVVTYYSVPLVDSLASFFIIAGFYAVLRGSLLGLGLTVLFGVFAKETTLILLLLVMLQERRFFSKKLLVCLPGAFLYILFITIFSMPSGFTIFSMLSSFTLLKQSILGGFSQLSFYALIENIQTFMFLWFLFFYALLKSKKPIFIKRALWLMVFAVLAPFLVYSAALGRIVFYLFPVVIPLSLLALRDILGISQRDSGNVLIKEGIDE